MRKNITNFNRMKKTITWLLLQISYIYNKSNDAQWEQPAIPLGNFYV